MQASGQARERAVAAVAWRSRPKREQHLVYLWFRAYKVTGLGMSRGAWGRMGLA